MLYPEATIYNEIRWEYGWPKQKILNLIETYKEQGRYELLCRLIEKRKSIA